ncbi:hypothetical protein [Luteimonas sp. A534]
MKSIALFSMLLNALPATGQDEDMDIRRALHAKVAGLHEADSKILPCSPTGAVLNRDDTVPDLLEEPSGSVFARNAASGSFDRVEG